MISHYFASKEKYSLPHEVLDKLENYQTLVEATLPPSEKSPLNYHCALAHNFLQGMWNVKNFNHEPPLTNTHHLLS